MFIHVDVAGEACSSIDKFDWKVKALEDVMKGERGDDGLMGTFAATGVTFLNPAFRKTFASFLTNERASGL